MSKPYTKIKGTTFALKTPKHSNYKPAWIAILETRSPKGLYWGKTKNNKREIISYYQLRKDYKEV